MCGILGGNLFSSEEQLYKSLTVTEYRGRDNVDVYSDDKVFLGHNRLSIQDLDDRSNQPFVSSSGDTIIVYNGELWKGYEDLKKKYLPNFNFKTNGDTEVILELYERYGTESFSMLDGMFSFVIYDKRDSTLVMCRDWVGKMPFYLHRDINGEIAFSSEMKNLTSIFSKIKADNLNTVKPATFSIYDLDNKEFKVFEELYYEIPRFEVDDEPEEISRNLKRLLEEGVEQRLISDVPLCTILSGGVDSTIITHILKKHKPDIEAYTVSVGDTGRKDDLYYARLASESLDVPLNEVILTPEYIKSSLDNSIYVVETNNWKQIATGMLMIPMAEKIGQDGYKVVLSGEGADEIFGSYNDVMAWHYKDDAYDKKRRDLISKLHGNNLMRSNKTFMYGGTVEMRSPFLHRPFVEYAININPKYKKIKSKTKPLLREAFRGEIDDILLNRPKVVFQQGAHNNDNIKEKKDDIKIKYNKIFNKKIEKPLF